MERENNFLSRLDKLKDYEKFTGRKIRFQIKPFKQLMEYMGYPNRDIPFPIGITGTKGKGSVGAFLSAMFVKNGYSTGLFTSPHVEDIRERIRINEKWIDEQLFEEIGSYVLDTVEKHFPVNGYRTFFEVMTATAIESFKKNNVEFGIFEVGLGGRLDATSVLPHKLVIINTIDIEHRKTLGRKLLDIAWEKTALIKPKSIVVIGKQRYSYVTDYIVKRAKERGAYPITIEEGMKRYNIRFKNNRSIEFKGITINPSLWGEHQMYNAIISLIAVMRIEKRGYKFDKLLLKEGLENAVWRGRLDILSENPLIIADGGHTPMSVEYAFKAIKDRFPEKRIKTIVALLRDKRIEEIAKIVDEYSDKVYLSEVNHKRGAKIEEIKHFFKRLDGSNKNLNVLFDSVRINLSGDECLLIIGSLYIIGDIIKTVNKEMGYG